MSATTRIESEAARWWNTERPLTHPLDLGEEGLATHATQPKRYRSYGPCECGCGTNVAGHYVRGHRPAATLAERLWSKVEQISDGCWVFQGATNADGYGSLGPTKAGDGMLAHRAAWLLTYGPIPDGLFVCHHCDNPPCCNPEHLFLGSPQDNVTDSIDKGRFLLTRPKGDDHANTRLTDAQVAEVVRRYRPGVRARSRTGASSTELAEEFGVHYSTIQRAIRRCLTAQITAATVPTEETEA